MTDQRVAIHQRVEHGLKPRLARAVIADLNKALFEVDPELLSEGNIGYSWYDKETYIWPTRFQWVACYALKGASEGYWVHIDIVTEQERKRITRTYGHLKVWSWEHAFKLSNACTQILSW